MDDAMGCDKRVVRAKKRRDEFVDKAMERDSEMTEQAMEMDKKADDTADKRRRNEPEELGGSAA